MAAPEASTPVAAEPKKRMRIDRTWIGLNVIIQLLIIAALVVMVNVISYRRFTRWDLSRNQNYQLSSKTKTILESLDQPVRAIVFFPQAQILTKDLFGLLREYEYASKKKFSVEYVDPYKNLTRAKELADQYKFGSNDNIVILDYKGKNKFVNAVDMAQMDDSMAMMGQPPTMKAFKGEEAITSALQSLTDARENKLYLLAGHGEPALESQEASVFKAYVDRENIKLGSLSLNNVDTVPADATGLMLFGAKTDFSDRELQLLTEYWTQKKGRLFVLLDPSQKTPRLNAWLSSQGVTPQEDRVLKIGSGLSMEGGQMAVKSNVIIGSPAVTYVAAGRAVTRTLGSDGIQAQIIGPTESLVIDNAKVQIDKLKPTILMQSGEGFWGETEYVPGGNRNVFFDPKKDHIGPLTVAVAIEKGGLEDVKVETSRMIVVGNATFLTSAGLQQMETGIDFALSAINWMFNREAVSGIPPKPKSAMELKLDESMIRKIYAITLVFIPLAAGVIGLYVTWHRRNRDLLHLTLWLAGAGAFIIGFLWSTYLFVTSRESGVSSVSFRDYLVPLALLVVSITALLLRLWRTSATPLPAHS